MTHYLIKYFISFRYSRLFCIIIFIFTTVIVTSYACRSYYIKKYAILDEEKWLDPFKNYKPKGNYRIVILMPTDSALGLGLRMFAKRIDVAAKNIGWNSYVVEENKDYFAQIKNINPDFIISTLITHEGYEKFGDYKIYAYFLQSTKTYFGGLFSFKPVLKEIKYNYLNKISGFLCAFKSISLMKEYKEKTGLNFYGFRTFPSSQKTNFKLINYDSIIYYGSNWDKIRSSNRFKIFFQNLDKHGLLNVYGKKDVWSYIPFSWKGFANGDGWNFIDLTRKHGISLVLHAKRYNKEGIPSGRIFEAAASSAIVISDKNRFVVDNFGDSVLYINAEDSANSMTEQVLSHYAWIKSNPEEARKKAKKMHEIFIEKFTLEQELIKIAKMHEAIQETK